MRLLAPVAAAAAVLAMLALGACSDDDDDGGALAAPRGAEDAGGADVDESEGSEEGDAEDDEADVPDVVPPGQDGACDAIRRISELDDEVQAEVGEAVAPLLTGQPDEDQIVALVERLREVLDDRAPMLFEAYDDLEVELPDDLADAAATLADFTRTSLEQLADIESPEDIQTALTGAGASEATAAALAIDEFAQAECGIVFAD